MPAPTSYEVVGNREDLTDLIQTLSNTDALWFSRFKEGPQAKGIIHEWQTDELATPGDNAHKQGQEFVGDTYTPRERLANYCQIFKKEPWMSDTQEAIAAGGGTAGVKSEYSRWVTKALKEMGRDVDYAFKVGVGASGASGTPAKLKGVLPFIDDNVISGTGTGTGAEPLTEKMLNDALQACWEDGGKADSVFAGAYNKRKISAFATPNQRYIEMRQKKAVGVIDIYEGDFALVKIYADFILNSAAPDTVAVLKMDTWRKCYLTGRRIKHVPLAKDGDRKRGMVVGELTLEARAPKHNAKIIQLTTSD